MLKLRLVGPMGSRSSSLMMRMIIEVRVRGLVGMRRVGEVRGGFRGLIFYFSNFLF